MNKKLKRIYYSQDDSKKELERLFNEIDNLMPKLNFQDREKARGMSKEIWYFINLKERDEDLERRGIR